METHQNGHRPPPVADKVEKPMSDANEKRSASDNNPDKAPEKAGDKGNKSAAASDASDKGSERSGGRASERGGQGFDDQRINHLLTEAQSSLGSISSELARRVKQHPYGAVAGGLGVGFVIGSGFWTLLARPIFVAGARIALAEAVRALAVANGGTEQSE